MPRPFEYPEREILALETDDEILENVFAHPLLPLAQLFDDPIVQKRIGELIGLAANRPRRRRRHRRSF
jgi:hypothetical protein